MSIGYCTLAIHAPYRQRAKLLCLDLGKAPFLILTDDPSDFAGLPVTAIFHEPTGPMAADYLRRQTATGQGRGAAAYHDKRFALQAVLREHDTAIFFDADSRLRALPPASPFPGGLAVLPVVRHSIATHLETCGSWRRPFFEDLARQLCGSSDVLQSALWCHETCIALTKDGREEEFFRNWDQAARLMQEKELFSGEGGAVGLAAHCAGWTVDHRSLEPWGALLEHEGGGPKSC